MVELEKGPIGLGMGLIDGLVSRSFWVKWYKVRTARGSFQELRSIASIVSLCWLWSLTWRGGVAKQHLLMRWPFLN